MKISKNILSIAVTLIGLLVLGSVFFSTTQETKMDQKEATNTNISENKQNYFERTNNNIPPLIGDTTFANGGYCWVVPSHGGKIYFRDNKGSWKIFKNPLIGFNSMVTFTDNKNGWLLVRSEHRLLKTQDSGETWKIIETTFGEEFFGGNEILFQDNQNGWISDAYGLWNTKDGGKNWKYIELGESDYPVSMEFFNGGTGWIGSSKGNIYKYNRNISFTKVSDIRTDSICGPMFFIDNKTGWIVCGGDLFKFNYSTQSWSKIGDQPLLSGIYFIDDKIGWAVGKTPYKDKLGAAAKTEDGGLTWNTIFIEKASENGYLMDIYFDKTDTNQGWIVGSHRIYKTTDGGQTWNIDLDINSEN